LKGGPIMKALPKAILFDLGGTLLHETRLEREAAVSWLLNLAGALRPEVLKPQLLEFYSEIILSLRAGGTEFPVLGFLKLALELAGASSDATEELELEFWKQLCSMEPLPGIEAVLAELKRRKIKMGVVSNSFCSHGVLRYELNRNGLLEAFQCIISSADYGIQKPHPLIFKVALARLGCDPCEAWFVGDNFKKDIVGASSVGMRGVWLTEDNFRDELPMGSIRISKWQDFLPLLTGMK
jgi:HAD superfamily hydrolase (TIGR01549 family)